MLGFTHIIRRISTGIAVAAALTAVAVPAALAGGFDGRSPDTRDAAQSAHESGLVLLDRRSPDTRDAALSAHTSTYGALDGWIRLRRLLKNASRSAPVLDGRSPDTRDFAAQAHSPVVTVVASPGFQWGDFGIGVAVALAGVLIVFVSTKLLAGRQARKQTSPVATA
jgi:hypothetical protein